MRDVQRSSRGRAAAVGALAMVVAVAAGACSLRTGLEGEQCQQEGRRSDGRVCRGGYWVEVRDTGLADVTPEDGGAGSCYYNGQARGVCQRGSAAADGGCRAPEDYEATESSCADGLDNDCDGDVDGEDGDCECSPGETESCYGGPPETKGTGTCTAGTRTCKDDGTWGACEGETRPAEEDCSTSADEDCGGDGNAGCSCNYANSDKGVCAGATVGVDGSCREPDAYAETDDENEAGLCDDDLDNDCDGVVNEHCSCTYDGKQEGVCGSATIDPESGECARPMAYDATDDESAAGLCDGKDNDCDGKIDENCTCQNPGKTKTFYNGPGDTKGVGICHEGELTCQKDGSWKETRAEQTPKQSESCGGAKDTDCNGAPDNGCPCSYDGTQTGVCGEATRDASGTCQKPAVYLDPESDCSDGVDNDCDGKVDEGCACNYDSTSTGVCGNATTVDGGTCQQPAEYQVKESDCSDGLDNDCDGKVDEGCACNYNDTKLGVCGNATTVDGGTCQQPAEYQAKESDCSDGLDNDCDGKTDEGCSCNYNNTKVGVCGTATTVDGGACGKPADYEPTESSCSDGIDNDCDGATDGADSNCGKMAGESCTSDNQCMSGVCDGDNGVCAQRIFVSSKKYTGDLGGLSGADRKCRSLANNAGLAGNWEALISDNNNRDASDLTQGNELVLVDGTVVSDGANFKLWDAGVDQNHAVDVTEKGTIINTCSDCDDDLVWTGSTQDGSSSPDNCNRWSLPNQNANPAGAVGDAGDKNAHWIQDDRSTEKCRQSHRIYCIDGR